MFAAENPLPLPVSPSQLWIGGGLVVLLIGALMGLMSVVLGKGSPKPGRVVGVVGLMGSGKSYLMVRMMVKALEQGADVASNFTMNLDPAKYKGTWRKFNGWDDFIELQGVTEGRKCVRRMVVMIDEAHLYAPSVGFKMPPAAVAKLSQARHWGMDVVWASQNELKVAKGLRDLTNSIYVCHSFFGGKMFSAQEYEPEAMRKKGKELSKLRYRMDVDVANLYDTLEIVDVDATLSDAKTKLLARKGAERDAGRGVTGAAAAAAAPAVAAVPAKAALAEQRWERCEHERKRKKAWGACRLCPTGVTVLEDDLEATAETVEDVEWPELPVIDEESVAEDVS